MYISNLSLKNNAQLLFLQDFHFLITMRNKDGSKGAKQLLTASNENE